MREGLTGWFEGAAGSLGAKTPFPPLPPRRAAGEQTMREQLQSRGKGWADEPLSAQKGRAAVLGPELHGSTPVSGAGEEGFLRLSV